MQVLIRDSFAPAPLSRPKRARKQAALAHDSASLSAASQLRQCPLGPQLSSKARNLSRQNRALGEIAAVGAGGGPAQAATAQIQAQMRQGLCPYLSQATQNNPAQDWSALSLLRESLEQGHTDPVDFLHDLHQNYGPSVKVGDVLFESRPEVVAQILVGTENPRPERTHFGKSTLQTQSLGQVYGDHTVFLENGAEWKAQRTSLQPHFVGRSVLSEANHQHLQDITDKHLDALPVGTPVDLNLKLRALSLDVAISHMFGMNLELGELENLAGLFERGGKVAQNKLFGLEHQDPGLQKELDGLADRLIASPTPAPTLQTLLANPQARDRGWLRQQVLMLTLLGHETTANLLTYSAAEISQNPRELAELRAEYQSSIGTAQPTLDQTTSLRVTRNAIKETTREHAPNYLVSREALQDVSVDGMLISAGTQVLMSIHDVNEQGNGKIFSFGGGTRVCMGQVLARLEAAVVLSQLLTRFDLEPTAQTSLAPKSDFSSRPADAHYTLHRTDIGQKHA